MKLRPLALSLCLALSTLASIPSTVTAQPAPVAASASATQRWTFDGAIHNNSLALSPDEGTAVVSGSIVEVSTAVREAGQASSDVLRAATVLGEQAGVLRNEIHRFLTEVRAA